MVLSTKLEEESTLVKGVSSEVGIPCPLLASITVPPLGDLITA